MKTLILFMLITFSLSVKAQHLDPLFSSKQFALKGPNYWPFHSDNPLIKEADFVYFPYPMPAQPREFDASFVHEKTYTDKAALYQQQLKLPGKLLLKGTLEVIPCNDLGYFVPEPIARNY